ncbi:aminoacyl-tRNA hydrolase [Candidatus Mycoplasma mahonii]|uniref:aminoacyl-tRNA hydrolase n=1 Tax=Candidatus Mycoplasma mahonii TaxID=3004105 RepID=UPI0026ECB640|nr:aminoacyl-tRNA hydrolase [Candidatus Mycoplasma mahonii]WKX02437.1 aminoacyl-tRNA hydrolase [Candidatus Mycoplasma mahonii]
MKLIVGLGNPGEKYEKTRHNIGFSVIDAFAHQSNLKLKKHKFNGIFYKSDDFILAKPETYINLSGDFVSAIVKFYKIQIEDILIIYDDMDHKVGTAVMKGSGSAGGQNGMKDIINKLGTNHINRLKIGIGRNDSSINHVLGKFSDVQWQKINTIAHQISQAINDFIELGPSKAMTNFNTFFNIG